MVDGRAINKEKRRGTDLRLWGKGSLQLWMLDYTEDKLSPELDVYI